MTNDSTDLSKFFGGHQLPSREKLTETLANFSAAKHSMTGRALLRLTKTGTWVFGIDNEAFDTDTLLIGNPSSLASGYIAWYQGKIEAEIMQPLSLGPVDPAKLGPVNSGSIPPGKKDASGRGWETQASIEFVSQEDVPLNLIYKVSSLGGMKALLELAGGIAVGLSENAKRVYPVIKLETDSYQHKEWGRVFTPSLVIVAWLNENGNQIQDVHNLPRKDSLI